MTAYQTEHVKATERLSRCVIGRTGGLGCHRESFGAFGPLKPQCFLNQAEVGRYDPIANQLRDTAPLVQHARMLVLKQICATIKSIGTRLIQRLSKLFLLLTFHLLIRRRAIPTAVAV